MKRIGDIIPEEFREAGSGFGPGYKYLFAHDLMNWIVWNRITGEIAFVAPHTDGHHNAMIKCAIFNDIIHLTGEGTSKDATG